jgi:hypothetical protein
VEIEENGAKRKLKPVAISTSVNTNGSIANWGLEIEKNAIKVNNALWIIKRILKEFMHHWRCLNTYQEN